VISSYVGFTIHVSFETCVFFNECCVHANEIFLIEKLDFDSRDDLVVCVCGYPVFFNELGKIVKVVKLHFFILKGDPQAYLGWKINKISTYKLNFCYGKNGKNIVVASRLKIQSMFKNYSDYFITIYIHINIDNFNN